MSSCGVTASTDGVGHSGLSSGLLLVDEVELDEEELVSAVEWIAMGVPSKINALRTTVVTSEKNLFIVAHPFFLYRYHTTKYSLQGTTQGRYLTGGVPPVRFSM